MSEGEVNAQIVRDFIERVWARRDVAALPEFWTEDCLNHAAPEADNRGLDALRIYHEQFFAAFAAFSDVKIKITQQLADKDWIATYVVTQATHTGPFFGFPVTGKTVTLDAIRMDRMVGGKIAEHRSVADVLHLIQQLQE